MFTLPQIAVKLHTVKTAPLWIKQRSQVAIILWKSNTVKINRLLNCQIAMWCVIDYFFPEMQCFKAVIGFFQIQNLQVYSNHLHHGSLPNQFPFWIPAYCPHFSTWLLLQRQHFQDWKETVTFLRLGGNYVLCLVWRNNHWVDICKIQ